MASLPIRTVRTISLHDTKTGRPQPLEPRDAGKVGIYACGPTVYSRIHVGNARPFVVFSLLKRYLEHEGLDVTFVANVTDINDKIYDAARQARVPSDELAREMTARYFADTERLGLGRPDHEPLATEYIGPIVELISELVERGHAYEAGGDVYFSVRSLDSYGELSHQDLENMDQGEGVEGADRKRDPADFALWKAAKPSEDTSWDSPWGLGRPGWHIECSAMAEALLGTELDVHGGGSDLVFPHHENEAAQTLGARGRPLARLWMHNGMLQLAQSDEKMSKSLGNIEKLTDVLDAFGRDALILYFCQGHYRQPIAYSRERMEEAARGVARIREAGRRLVDGPSPEGLAPLRERFFAALADDFNTAQALGVAFEWIGEANRRDGVGSADLREMLGVLALDNLLDAGGEAAPAEVLALVEARTAAREARDWAEADRLRAEARALGWEIRDGPDGPETLPLA